MTHSGIIQDCRALVYSIGIHHQCSDWHGVWDIVGGIWLSKFYVRWYKISLLTPKISLILIHRLNVLVCSRGKDDTFQYIGCQFLRIPSFKHTKQIRNSYNWSFSHHLDRVTNVNNELIKNYKTHLNDIDQDHT